MPADFRTAYEAAFPRDDEIGPVILRAAVIGVRIGRGSGFRLTRPRSISTPFTPRSPLAASSCSRPARSIP